MTTGEYSMESNQNVLQKERLLGIEFSRALCAVGIVIFHYFCHSKGSFKFFYQTANSSWGFIFVTCFFAISGAVLYYNYPRVSSLKTFYFKRWKSVYPAFYLCFAFFFLKKVFAAHKLFYRGSPLKLLWTLFGIDGYFAYRFPSYFDLVGEWFLGGLIILYILYPLFSFCLNKNVFIIPVVLAFGYVIMFKTQFFKIRMDRNLITCAVSFYCGMVAIKYNSWYYSRGGVQLF